MNRLDDQLEALRNKHRAVARYTIYLSSGRGRKREKVVIESGLHWDQAKPQLDSMNQGRADKRMAAPIYTIELE